MNQYYFLVHFIHQMILNIFFNKNMKTATYIYFFEKIKWIIFERIMLLSLNITKTDMNLTSFMNDPIFKYL